jgi:hypothetical protein
MDRQLERSAFVATIGAGILAVVALKDLLEHFWSEPRYYRWAILAGTAAIGVSLLLIVVWWIKRARDLAGNLSLAPYEVTRVRAEEIDDFHSFCESILGPGVASKERMRQWQKKNPNILYLVFSEDRKHLRRKRKPVGFFSVFPVTKEASEQLWCNQLKGTEIGPQHIVSAGRKASAIYMGGVGADGLRAKQQTFGALVGQVAVLEQNTPLIFTRPINEVGRARARGYGFRPVLSDSPATEDMIYYRTSKMGLRKRPGGSPDAAAGP